MRKSLTAADVLNDIEFELMQGNVANDELGQGIQTTRQYQNGIRAETLQLVINQKIDSAELVARQFQINDMLLSLFQAVDAKFQALQAELRRAAYLKQHAITQSDLTERGTPSSTESSAIADTYPKNDGWVPEYVGLDETSDDLTDAMQDDALDVPIDVRPVSTPVVGWFLTRLRTSFHVLTLFYVEQLARKQTPINRTMGEHILRLEQANQQQQAQIEMLSGQLADLQKRLDE